MQNPAPPSVWKGAGWEVLFGQSGSTKMLLSFYPRFFMNVGGITEKMVVQKNIFFYDATLTADFSSKR